MTQPLVEEFRDRIKAFRRIRAGDLAPNPRNWRRHPRAQREALRAILQEVGFAGALLARETSDGLVLIDGHLRADVMTKNAEVPVLVLDVNEEEADKILATLDPLGAMARPDADALLALLKDVEFESGALNAMLEALANSETQPMPDWSQSGMPEFEQGDTRAYRTLTVHFANEEDVRAFAHLTGLALTDKTKWAWYPKPPDEKGVHEA